MDILLNDSSCPLGLVFCDAMMGGGFYYDIMYVALLMLSNVRSVFLVDTTVRRRDRLRLEASRKAKTTLDAR